MRVFATNPVRLVFMSIIGWFCLGCGSDTSSESIVLELESVQLSFDKNFPHFDTELSDYIYKYSTYVSYLDTNVNKFLISADRGGVKILKPFVFTVNPEEVLVGVSSKGFMLDSSHANTTHYIKATYVDNAWVFSKIDGYVRLHRFAKTQPDVFSDRAYVQRMIEDLQSRGYYRGTGHLLNKSYLGQEKL